MATGRSAKLTGQVGEFLVCAELGRRGIIATPFAGNVPEFDVVATGEGLVTVPIQVKASNGTSWQTRLDRWLDVGYDTGRRRHVLHGKRRLRGRDLIYVYVALDEDKGDRFFILPQARVRDIVYRDYVRRMEPHGFRRPNKPESMHWAIHTRQLTYYEDDWDLVLGRCKRRGPGRSRRR